MTSEETRSRLLKLEPAILAEALLALAERDTAARKFVLQLTASPGESCAVSKAKLSGYAGPRK
jgi:hypothetical protein